MQQTRLNSLISKAGNQLELLFNNPWRRVSLNLISLLLGFFMASAIVSSAGQDAVWDITGAGVVIIFVEILNRSIYGRKHKSSASMRRSLLVDILTNFKTGLTYGLFLEAFKMNS